LSLGKFKVTCYKCGSDNILEKSGRARLERKGNRIIYGEGVQRRCQDCDNEELYILRTREERDKR
jgi:RNase P subunit RPR2